MKCPVCNSKNVVACGHCTHGVKHVYQHCPDCGFVSEVIK